MNVELSELEEGWRDGQGRSEFEVPETSNFVPRTGVRLVCLIERS
jgi:hypothetical protein